MTESEVTMTAAAQKSCSLTERARLNNANAAAKGYVRFNSISHVTSVLSQMFRHLRESHNVDVRLLDLTTLIPDTEVSYDYKVGANVLVPTRYIEGWVQALGEICTNSTLKNSQQFNCYAEAVTALHSGMSGDIDKALAFIGGMELAAEEGQ